VAFVTWRFSQACSISGRLVAACERAAVEAGVALQRAILLSDKPARPAAETALAGIRRLELGYPLMDADRARQGVDLRDLEGLIRLLQTLAAAPIP